jgi:hypothetical protein
VGGEMGSKETQGVGEGKEKVKIAAHEGRRGGKGIFGLEEKADECARQAKLQCLAEEIETYDRGYSGPHRRCPRCGQAQRYKGDIARVLVFDCGTLTVQRAYIGVLCVSKGIIPWMSSSSWLRNKNKAVCERSWRWWRY